MNIDPTANVEQLAKVADTAIEGTKSILSWFNEPKDEAREHLVELIKTMDLPKAEAIALIYNSRKLAREYANAKNIYEKAKSSFEKGSNITSPDEDWLHFFFDKAEKVTNKSMQSLWAKLRGNLISLIPSAESLCTSYQ